ncbi:MAG: aromatic ring-hydroxylating dioxygenase subunit alpha [Nocardioides sp.]
MTSVEHSEHTKTTFELLTNDYYTSEEIFAREYERIYSQDWVFAGHVSQFPAKGSFIKLEHGGEEVIVVRGAGEEFFAHLNVCRHRGFRLCEESSGKVRAFVCGYHQWRYDLDGSLRGVPQMKDGEYFDYADFPLRTARVEVWHGMVFVNLKEGEVESLGARLRGFDALVDRFAPEGTKLAHEEVYTLRANWKIAAENALECYHCPGTHRSLCAVVDVAGLQADLGDWLADEDGDGPSDLGYSGMRLLEGMKSLSADGSLVTEKLLGSCTEADHGTSGGVMVVPNFFYAAFYVDHWWTLAIRPISALETRIAYTWYVREDAVEGEDYDVQKLIEVGHTTQTEDNVLIERTQRGVDSRYFVPGPIGSDVEPALHDFVSNYLKFMA